MFLRLAVSIKCLLLRQVYTATNKPPPAPRAREFADNWLKRSLESSLINKAHHDRCASYPKKTADEADAEQHPPQPNFTGSVNFAQQQLATPVHDEARGHQPQMYPLQDGQTNTQLPPHLAQLSTTPLLTPVPQMISPLRQASQTQAVPSPVTAYNEDSQEAPPTSVPDMQQLGPSTSYATHANLLMIDTQNTVQSQQTPRASIQTDPVTPTEPQYPGSNSQTNHSIVTPSAVPQHIPQGPHPEGDTEQQETRNEHPIELPSPKRTRLDLVKQVKETDVTTQNILLATTLEKLFSRMDKLECTLKSKIKEVSEAQTQDITNKIQLAVTNALSEEAFQYKAYTKSLVATLQSNILNVPLKK